MSIEEKASGAAGAAAVRSWFAKPSVASFIAGGLAGAVSRTIVSPFERTKIIFQVQGPGHPEYSGVGATLARIWREEGWRGYMHGNGLNCIRIVPYSAIQFWTYAGIKKSIKDRAHRDLNVYERLFAGGIAGALSVCATYPMDLVRTRLSVQTAAIGKIRFADTRKPPGMWRSMVDIYRHEGGLRGLWRGLIPTTLGVAPYVSINFATYEYLRKRFVKNRKELSAGQTLVAGALSGTFAQTLTYPFDVLRRRFQVNAMGHSEMNFRYTSVGGALKSIARKEGYAGMFKGLMPNILKVVPSMAAYFLTYEWAKRILTADHRIQPARLQ